jgi:hypothetical protein
MFTPFLKSPRAPPHEQLPNKFYYNQNKKLYYRTTYIIFAAI